MPRNLWPLETAELSYFVPTRSLDAGDARNVPRSRRERENRHRRILMWHEHLKTQRGLFHRCPVRCSRRWS